MQSFILPLLFILFSSGTAVIIFKKKFEEVVPLSLMISMLLVFTFAYFDYMLIGYYLSIFIALLFPFLLIYSFIKKQAVEVLKRFFTPSLLIFLAIYLFIFILNRNRGFTVWDEISHWGPMVKEMLRLDRLYSVPESALAVHKDYPPIVPIFEYIWCKLSGGYEEAFVYRALQILSLSLFFPALSNIKWKKDLISIIRLFLIPMLILFSCLVITVGEAHFFKTIYIDCFLGLMFAYSMFLAFTYKKFAKFEWIRFVVGLSVLLLTKQMGLTFFLITVGFFSLNYIYVNFINSKKSIRLVFKKRIKDIVYFILLLTIPLFFFFGWSRYVQINDLSAQFSVSDIEISQVYGIVRDTSGEEYQREAYKNFENMFISTPIVTRPISISYWQMILLSILLWELLAEFSKEFYDEKKIHLMNFVTIVGALGYSFIMLLLYLFNFTVNEALIVVCYSRYMGTYWFAILTLLSMSFLFLIGRRSQELKISCIKSLLVILTLIVVVFLEPSELYVFKKPPQSNNSIVDVYREDSRIINENTKENDKIYIISQEGCFVGYGLSYLTLPRQINIPFEAMTLNIPFDPMSLGVPYCPGHPIFTKTREEFSDALLNYDFLYFHQIDDYFIQQYADIFPEDLQLKNKQLFKIIQDSNESVRLELLVEG